MHAWLTWHPSTRSAPDRGFQRNPPDEFRLGMPPACLSRYHGRVRRRRPPAPSALRSAVLLPNNSLKLTRRAGA